NVSYGSAVDMPTIHGFVFAILGRKISGTELNIIVAGLSIALLSWIAMRWERDRQNSPFDLMFAAALAASLLSGSHMFTHDFSPLILAMLLVVGHISGRSSARTVSWDRIAIRTSLVLFWIFPIYFLCVKW